MADLPGMGSVERELLERLRRLERRVTAQDCLIADLKHTIALKDQRIAELEAELAKRKKDSSTSSKSPSSDIVKPKRSGEGKGKRKRGAQHGHERYERPAFPPEEIDEIVEYSLDACPDCGGPVEPLTDEASRTLQQVEVAPKPIQVTEHRGKACWCGKCQKAYKAPLPPVVEKAGLVGPRLTAVVAYLKGGCHASFSTIRKYLRDVMGVTISRGHLRKVVDKTSQSLEEAYEQLFQRLRAERRLNIDETGHKDYAEQYWTWCFRAAAFTVFKISGSRSAQVLFDVLGREFEGVIGCDYYAAYRKYMRETSVLVQFCLAHLIRDVKYLTTLSDPGTVAYGHRLLRGLRRLFRVFHGYESETPEAFQTELDRARWNFLAVAEDDVPDTADAQNMAERFRKHGKAYFEFITTPGIEPTNNSVEQAIRFVVIDRHVTQGTRSERGREWCERIWTVMATCAQQGRSAFHFIEETVKAHFAGRPTPSLLPDTG